MTSLTLGINTGFAINRFPEPEQWARIVTEELQLSSVQLVADLLNPFWPSPVIEAEVARIQNAVCRYGITIHSLMTSAFTRVNHLLHPHLESRQAWSEWFRSFADLAARLGARAVGSHFGILSVHDALDPARYRERVDEGIRRWQELSFYARDVGLEYIYFETMSIPREMAHTIAEAKELHARVNEHAGVPMVYCLDVGHAPHPDERDPYLWLRELGCDTRIVHLQQTEAGKSRHWPFVSPYNEVGIIDPTRVIDALCEAGAGDILLAFEISHRESFEQDSRVVDDLKASAAYWRRFLPQDGRCRARVSGGAQ
jgi:sugar phosphate isomerase/epimerase